MEDVQTIIKWVEGKPVPTHIGIMNKEAVAELPITVLSLPYERTEFEKEMGVDKEFEGLTNGEVALIIQARRASRGDSRALDMLMDRIVGKPKQQVESKNLNLTYEDWLKEKAKEISGEDERNNGTR